MSPGKDMEEPAGAGRLILVIGGASSGKSAFALKLAGEKAKRAFVATAQPLDAEMGERIRRHRAERGPGWDTAEVPLHLTEWFSATGKAYDAIVVECVTLWLSNLREYQVPDDHVPGVVERLIHAIRITSACVVVVSNELGWGLVPMEPEARRFRELAGQVNQQLAKEADEVYVVTAGLPLRLKPKE